jgi:hypothetical protein
MMHSWRLVCHYAESPLRKFSSGLEEFDSTVLSWPQSEICTPGTWYLLLFYSSRENQLAFDRRTISCSVIYVLYVIPCVGQEAQYLSGWMSDGGSIYDMGIACCRSIPLFPQPLSLCTPHWRNGVFHGQINYCLVWYRKKYNVSEVGSASRGVQSWGERRLIYEKQIAWLGSHVLLLKLKKKG